MELLYLGGICNPEDLDALIRSDPDFSQAAYNYEYNFISHLLSDGLIAPEHLEILSCVPQPDSGVAMEESILGARCEYVCNKSGGVGQMLRGFCKAFKAVRRWVKRTTGSDRLILTYAVNPLLVVPALAVSAFHRDIRLVTICSEEPRFRDYSYMPRWKARIVKRVNIWLNERMDAYIFLSKYMNETGNRRHKPWVVVESFSDVEGGAKSADTALPAGKATVMYAGGLEEANGIGEFLDSIRFADPGVEYVICGNGRLRDRVQKASEDEPRIRYLGVIPHETVVALERTASILINPRKPDGLLTRYAFPSKTSEYLSNGAAVTLIARLDGIPDEYYAYCDVLESVTAEAIGAQINEILHRPEAARLEQAKRAREFIVREKSSAAQAAKAFRFLQSL